MKQSVGVNSGASSGVTNNSISEFVLDWTEGTGGTPFFNQNGATSENSREYGVAPNGNEEILWKCDDDLTSNADGGWNTDYFAIDRTKKYRYATWVKRTGSQDGRTYHGIRNVAIVSGGSSSNPYFWNGDLPELDQWYLMVGVIHPATYSGGNSGESGVYDIQGNKVANGNDFKWPTASLSIFASAGPTTTSVRSYFYYSVDAESKQYFWNPTFEEITTSSGDVDDLISSTVSQVDIVTHYEYDGLGRQIKNYLSLIHI